MARGADAATADAAADADLDALAPRAVFGAGDDASDGDDGAWTTDAPLARAIARDATRDALERGFHRGDVVKILRDCRHATNARYEDEDVERATTALRDDGATVNAPFCFAPGAIALKRALHLEAWRRVRADADARADVRAHAGGGVGYGECEVGAYVSLADGDVAEWHRDVCDNATIQLRGRKRWEVEMYEDAADGTALRDELRGKSRNAAATDEERCGVDYAEPVWADHRGHARYETCEIGPGETICVPRGRMHRVTPIGDDVSVSVDIRMSTIESAEIAAEIAYLKVIGRYDEMIAAGDARWTADERFNLPAIRWLPFEEEFSDGLVLGARLEYIVAAAPNAEGRRDDVATYESVRRDDDADDARGRSRGDRYATAAFHPSCACEVREDDAREEYYVFNVKATSALTNKDLMSEFNIYVRRDAVRDGEMSAFASPLHFLEAELERVTRRASPRDRDPTSRKRDRSARDSREFSDAIVSLRAVLFDANILLPPGNCWSFFWINATNYLGRWSSFFPHTPPPRVRVPALRESLARRASGSKNSSAL